MQATLPSIRQQPSTTNSIAVYVQATGTIGIYGSQNMQPLTQTSCQHTFALIESAVEVVDASDDLLKCVSGRVRASYCRLVGERNQDLSDAAYSIAAYAMPTRSSGPNDSESGAANEIKWKAVA